MLQSSSRQIPEPEFPDLPCDNVGDALFGLVYRPAGDSLMLCCLEHLLCHDLLPAGQHGAAQVYICTDHLGLYEKYGYYLAYVQSIELSGSDAMEKAAKMMADLRAEVPASIGGAVVTGVRDYKSSIAKDLTSGEETVINLPKSNVLEFLLGDKGSVIARPSGTEPKVKFYYTAVGETKEAAKLLLDAMVAQMSV